MKRRVLLRASCKTKPAQNVGSLLQKSCRLPKKVVCCPSMARAHQRQGKLIYAILSLIFPTWSHAQYELAFLHYVNDICTLYDPLCPLAYMLSAESVQLVEQHAHTCAM